MWHRLNGASCSSVYMTPSPDNPCTAQVGRTRLQGYTSSRSALSLVRSRTATSGFSSTWHALHIPSHTPPNETVRRPNTQTSPGTSSSPASSSAPTNRLSPPSYPPPILTPLPLQQPPRLHRRAHALFPAAHAGALRARRGAHLRPARGGGVRVHDGVRAPRERGRRAARGGACKARWRGGRCCRGLAGGARGARRKGVSACRGRKGRLHAITIYTKCMDTSVGGSERSVGVLGSRLGRRRHALEGDPRMQVEARRI